MDLSPAARCRSLLRDDEGIGLMETVVAMFVLAILAMSLLPLLITGMQAAVANTTTAAATQFANDRMSIAQAMGANSATPCTDIETLETSPATMFDARGVELRAVTTVGACPSGVGTISVATAVSRIDTGDVLARATTAVLVVP
jgi:type II secretory pathway pseudopilin PulG